MRLLHLALATPVLLLACASEPPPPPPPRPVAQPAAPSNQVTFPNAAEIAAGRPIRIRPAANFGAYGVLQPLPGAPACGVLQQGRSPRPLPVASTTGDVTPAFNIAGRCPRNDDGRGMPFVRMDRAWTLPNGIYMQGAQHHCLLPNVGSNAVCVPRS
ncbi:hypothetical protein [Sediminicoccus sp. KRV36]|uniref:hypothetical protein n=1 Tax=Sediminicoccus sp. KRV36 TaxID=3133721 RepID=UPI00200CA8FB|nr:hypothetical protein [Sediminicoccus rosea]UPY38537.1 hypothetical protein LHU95_07535 [Sediminicoccus rosea]